MKRLRELRLGRGVRLIAAVSILWVEGICPQVPLLGASPSSKLWPSGDAPPAYLGGDLTLKQDSADGAKFVISGKKPGVMNGLDLATARTLKPVDLEIGTKSGKPVYLEIFTDPNRADDVAGAFKNHARWTEVTEQLKERFPTVQAVECAPPAAMVCARMGRDDKGQPQCKEYKCERHKP